MTDSMDDLRQASADASGVEVLSPAAQAILDAAVTAYDDEYLYTRPMTRHAGAVAAAALRVAVLHAQPKAHIKDMDYVPQQYVDGWGDALSVIHDIADELEGRS